MDEALRRYVRAAQEVNARDEAERAEERRVWWEELEETARLFVEEHGLRELLEGLGVARYGERRDVFPPLRFGLEYEGLAGHLDFWYQYGELQAVMKFSGVTLGCYLPAGKVEIGRFLLRVEEAARDAHVWRVNRVKSRLWAAGSVDALQIEMAAARDELGEGDWEGIRKVYEEKRAALEALAEVERRAARRAAMERVVRGVSEVARLRLQADLFQPFVVYKVRYGVAAEEEGAEWFVDVWTFYALRPEPDGDGWWDVIDRDGQRSQRRYVHVVSVERVVVEEPGPGRFCVNVDGVWVAPDGVELV